MRWIKLWKSAVLLLLAACSPVSLANRMISRTGYHVVNDLAYGTDPRQKLDFYVPDHPTGPVLLFFYGGGWQGGSKSLYPAFGQAFAAKGILVAIAWLLVIIPAAWGVTQTIRQSMVLFSAPAAPATQPARI